MTEKPDWYTPRNVSTDYWQKSVIKAKAIITKEMPYAGPLLYGTKIELTEDFTSFTDGKSIVISKRMSEAYPNFGMVFVLAHELFHLLLRHHERSAQLQMKEEPLRILYNILADAKIWELLTNNALRNILQYNIIREEHEKLAEDVITHANVITVLDKILLPGWRNALDNHNIAVLEIDKAFGILKEYLLPPTAFQNPYGPGNKNNPFKHGKVEEATHKEIMKRIAEGITTTRGTETNKLIAEIDKLWFKREVPFRKIIKRQLLDQIKYEWTYKKPHKKSVPLRVLLPSKKKHETARVLIAIDTSGSVPDKAISKFLNEIDELMKKQLATVKLITFDVEIHQEFDLKQASDMKEIKQIHGRGGTSCKQVIAKAVKEKWKNLIIMTDGYLDQDEIPAPPKHMNMWWILTRECEMPWGKKYVLTNHDMERD